MAEFNSFLFGFLCLYIGQTVVSIRVERLNSANAERYSVTLPPGFEELVDGAKLATIRAYTRARGALDNLASISTDLALLIVLFSGFLPLLIALSERLELGPIPAGLLFFFAPQFILFLAELPFSYYHTFVLEQRFGFNRSTRRLWITDLLKGGLISAALFSALLSALILLIEREPEHWWFWGFLITSALQVIIGILYPILFAPLFNRFEPVRDQLLAARISALMEANGIDVKCIAQMNAGLRSSHTNAYFSGFGKTRQIVLYDTLIESYTHDEILAVLAHEAGHFRGKHVIKLLALFSAFSLGGFYLASFLLQWPLLYTTFGFNVPIPYVGLFLTAVLGQKAAFFLQPIYKSVSRKFETEADLFAAGILMTGHTLAAALKKLATDNLANLFPHPLYVWFHYAHPPLMERIARLEKAGRSMEKADTGSREREDIRR